MTLAEFTPICTRLARQLRADVSADDVRDYVSALAEFDREDVATAAQSLAVEPGRRFFPSTAQWAERAKKAQRERLLTSASTREPWRVECDACEDTGWRRHECDGTMRFCGRRQPHAAHEWVERCPCRPSNRTFQRHHGAVA